LPAVFDDLSFALSLGLQNRTVWWLVHATSIDRLENGEGTYDVFQVPKKRGGHRTIHAPRATLKRVQRVLMQVYFNPLPVNDCVGAYVLGRDMVYSVNKHVGKDVVISMDLSNFFGTTKRRWVREWLTSLGYNDGVVLPMSGLLTVPFRRKSGYVSYAVPQGAPTSGIVTNHVAAARLDAPMLEFLAQTGLKRMAYTRYADDLTISFDGFLPKDIFDNLMRCIKLVVAESGYYLNNSKTRVATSRPGQPVPQRMLGMTINEKPNVPWEKKHQLRARVHHIVTTRAAHYDEPNLWLAAQAREKTLRTLAAELRYWARISPQTIQPLLNQLQAFVGTIP
jgi:hypothetical protein